MRRLSSFAMMVLLILLPTATGASIMCPPDWLYGRPATNAESIAFMKQLAKHNADHAGKGAEARLCPKLDQFRLYVRSGCISQRHLSEIEQAFSPYDCRAG